MIRYQFVSETFHRGVRITLPDHARGVTVVPTTRPDILRVTFLSPLHRFTPRKESSTEIELGKH